MIVVESKDMRIFQTWDVSKALQAKSNEHGSTEEVFLVVKIKMTGQAA